MQIGRDRNDAILGQFIAQTADPVGEAKNLADDEHGRGFVFALGINNKRFDRALARFDIDPIAMPWGSV